MAKGKSKDKIDINELEKRLSSKFGTKMPGNANKQESINADQYKMMQIIMGSLATFIWGEKSVTSPDKGKNLLSRTNNIYSLIESIKENIDSYSFGVKGNKSLRIYIADIDPNLLKLLASNNKNESYSDIEKLADSISQLGSNITKQTEVIKSLDHILNFKPEDFINTLKIDFDFKGDGIKDINKLIETLDKYKEEKLSETLKSLAGFIKDISPYALDKDTFKGLYGLQDFIKILNGKELDTKNVKKNITNLSKIISGKQDSLKSIFEAIKEISMKVGDESYEIDENTDIILSSFGNFFTAIIKFADVDKKKLKQINRNLKYLENYITCSLVDFINDIKDSLKDISGDFSEALDSINDLLNNILSIGEYSFKDLIYLDFKLSYLSDIIDRDIVGEKDSGIIVILSKLNGNTLKSVIAKSNKLSELFDILGNLVNNDSFTLKNVISFLIKLKLISLASDLINGNVELIAIVIKRLNQIKPNVEKVKDIYEIINELLALKGNVLGARSLKLTLKIIKGSVGLIKQICDQIKNDIDPDDIKHAKEVINTFTNLLFKAAGILLLAGLVMRFINPVKLMLFTVTLGAFMWGISKVFSLMSKTIQDDIKVSKDAIELVAISGAILILGGVAMNLIAPGKLMLFALTLGAFMVLIATSYLIFNLVKDETFKSAKDFSYLIMVSAGILIIGAIFMLSGLGLQALEFGGMVALFIGVVMFAYKLASKNMGVAFKSAGELAVLIGVSAMTLTIGALFVSSPKRIIGVITFALLLAGFIFLIMATIKWASKDIKSALSTMIAISVLVTIAAATLLLGGTLFTLFPNLVDGVIMFGLVLLGFVAAITGICWLLNKFVKHIILGVVLLAGIVAILTVAIVAMGLLAVVTKLIEWAGGHEQIMYTIITMGALFGGLALLCGIIGIPKVAMFVGLGIIVMAAMTVLLYLMIGAMTALVALTKYANTLDKTTIDNVWGSSAFKVGVIGRSIWGLVKLGPAFIALSAELPFMLPGIMATLMLSAALSTVAHTIKLWADLKIPEYGTDGKIIGYKTIDDAAFTKAADNIKTVLTTLFGAIKEVYDNDTTGMFGVGGWDNLGTFLLTCKSPFARVISSSMKLGNMLSSIASGIKDWAKLRIPEYGKDGKITGYKTIDNAAFVNAAENIKAVITCLGQAIIDTYESATEGMFESKEWFGLGNTPFGKVTKALKTMGPMLSSIASGVKDWAELKIPIYEKGENGPKIVDYKYLGHDELKTAQGNIVMVVSALAQGVLDVYEKNPEMFDDDSWLGLNHTPFAIVCRSLKTMGSALGNIADAVQDWADLKIPEYNDRKDPTKITGYKTINDAIFIKVAKNISYVVTALANSIASLAQGELGPLFTEEDFWSGKTKVQKVLKSIQPMGSALKDIADALEAWSSLKVPEYNDKKNPTKISGYKQLSLQDITDAQANMSLVIKGLIEGIANVYNMKDENGFEYKTLFDSTGALFWKSDSPVVKVLNAINPIGKALKNIADALKAWAELKIPIYGKTGIDPIGYMSIGGDKGINAATDNIQKVLKAMIKAVASVYYGKIVIGKGEPIEYQKLFENDDKSIINIMTEQMSKVAGLISKAAKGVQDIANLRIPVYNSKGKIIKYNNIEDGTFNKVGTVIATVLTAIGKAIINVSTDPLLNPEDNPSFATAVEAIKYSTDILSGIADVIANYASGKFVMYKVEKGKLVPDKLIDINSTDVQQAIQNNIKTVLYTIGDALAVVLGIGAGNNLKYATDKNKGQIEKTKNVIVTLINSIGEIYKAIGDLNNITKTNKDAINALIAPAEGESKLGDLLNFIIIELNDIAGKFDDAVKTNLKSLSENSADLIKDLDNTYSVLNKTLVVISKLANANFKVKNTDFGYITSAIEKFTTALSAINEKINNSKALTINSTRQLNSLIVHSKKLVELLNNVAEIIKSCKISNDNDYKGLENSILGLSLAVLNVDNKNNLNFKAFTDLIDNYIKVINTISGSAEFDNKVNSLKDGILNLNQIIKEVESKNDFVKQVKDLERYIDVINRIELGKLSQLKGFVDALNQLSSRLGNLDNLTDTLANRLTNVLFELVKQLRVADKSIQNAQKLQEYRKKLIEESVDKVRTLMDQPMIVEISQNTDGSNYMTPPSSGGTTPPNEPQSPPAGAVDGNPVPVETPQNSDTDEPKKPMMLDNPDAEADKNKNKFKFSPTYAQNHADNDTLTKSDFLALMAMNSKGWGET